MLEKLAVKKEKRNGQENCLKENTTIKSQKKVPLKSTRLNI
jgi:hypothetical protein